MKALDASHSSWRPDELQRLLAAVLSVDDWEKIAAEVGGGRTAEECLMQFVRLPLSEGMTDDVPAPIGVAATPDTPNSNLTMLQHIAAKLPISVVADAAAVATKAYNHRNQQQAQGGEAAAAVHDRNQADELHAAVVTRLIPSVQLQLQKDAALEEHIQSQRERLIAVHT